jgi:uncharacterized phage protein (TIGR02220 family)
MSKNAYYFSHDSNARNDTKILSMRCDYGLDGYGMYWVIIEVLREETDYKLKLDKHTFRALAMQMHMDHETVKKFIEDCINEYGLFQSDGETFWTESLLQRMEKVENIRAKRRKAANKRWNNEKDQENTQKTTKNNAKTMQMHSKSNANAMQDYAKEKKRKEKKRNETGKENKRNEKKEGESTIYVAENDDANDPIPYAEIVNYLNEKTGKSYKSTTTKTREHIRARFKEGFTLNDFKKVIDKKYKEWGSLSEWKDYLRPNTLFATKFENYLQQGEDELEF